LYEKKSPQKIFKKNLNMLHENNNNIFREQETPGVILGAKEIFDFVDSRYRRY
jgi:hypothetical protein